MNEIEKIEFRKYHFFVLIFEDYSIIEHSFEYFEIHLN